MVLEEEVMQQCTTATASPVTVLPTNRAVDVAGLPVISAWTRVPDATSYDVEVSTSIAFNDIAFSASNVTDTTVGLTNLANNTRYFWHVRSNDADTSGVWSERVQFTTGLLTSVDEDNASGAFHISPNPAEDFITVSLRNTECSASTYVISNLEGREVMSGVMHSSSHNISIRTLPAGSYVFTSTCGKEKFSTLLQRTESR
jgi:hypothetical protein